MFLIKVVRRTVCDVICDLELGAFDSFHQGNMIALSSSFEPDAGASSSDTSLSLGARVELSTVSLLLINHVRLLKSSVSIE